MVIDERTVIIGRASERALMSATARRSVMDSRKEVKVSACHIDVGFNVSSVLYAHAADIFSCMSLSKQRCAHGEVTSDNELHGISLISTTLSSH